MPIDILTLVTGLLFEETYERWRRLQTRYEVRIRGVEPVQSVDAQAAAHGDRLWELAPDRCFDRRKVVPLREQLAHIAAWITAIRRDQTPRRANTRVVEWDAK